MPLFVFIVVISFDLLTPHGAIHATSLNDNLRHIPALNIINSPHTTIYVSLSKYSSRRRLARTSSIRAEHQLHPATPLQLELVKYTGIPPSSVLLS